MSENHERNSIREKHPVHLRSAALATRASEELYALIDAAVTSKWPGFVALSRPRMGLSTALHLVAGMWRSLQPTVPIFVVLPDGQLQAPKQLWPSLLRQLSPVLATSGSEGVFLQRLIHHLTTETLARKGDRVLLVIDSAHRLTPEHLLMLTGLQDRVKLEDVHLVVALCGYRSLLDYRDCLYADAFEEPVWRYFERELVFKGMTSAEDFRYFLSSFDHKSYPPQSEWSYTRFYFRDAFDRGWRLSHDAATTWSILRAIDRDSEGDVEIEIGYVNEVICSILEEAYPKGFSAFPPTENDWRTHAMQCGIAHASHLREKLRKAERGGR